MSDTDNNTEARQTTLPNDLRVVAYAWIGGKAFEMELNLDALRTASEDSILRYLGLWSSVV